MKITPVGIFSLIASILELDTKLSLPSTRYECRPLSILSECRRTRPLYFLLKFNSLSLSSMNWTDTATSRSMTITFCVFIPCDQASLISSLMIATAVNYYKYPPCHFMKSTFKQASYEPQAHVKIIRQKMRNPVCAILWSL